MGILQDAIDNWPEDEAFNLLCDWKEMESDSKQQAGDIKYLESVFDGEPDGDELKRRFFERLKRGL